MTAMSRPGPRTRTVVCRAGQPCCQWGYTREGWELMTILQCSSWESNIGLFGNFIILIYEMICSLKLTM